MTTKSAQVITSGHPVHRARARLRRPGRSVGRTLGAILRGLVLSNFVYVFLFPVIFMLTTSVKTVADLNNPLVNWISRNPTVDTYRLAAATLTYFEAVRVSAWTSILAALGQTLVGAMVAYGFARIPFPGRGFLFGLLLFSVIVPLQTIMIPQFMLYSRLEWINTFIPIVLPPWVGYGVRGGILLIVYRQFFRGLPPELEDAAYVDGAGSFRTFSRIMFPLAKPAILVVFLFSLVWTWNDSFLPIMVLGRNEMKPLSIRMIQFYDLIRYQETQAFFGGRLLLENTFMAAVTLTVAPMLIMYIFAQRYFTQSIDRTGLVE